VVGTPWEESASDEILLPFRKISALTDLINLEVSP
jgi:hypothetical protein